MGWSVSGFVLFWLMGVALFQCSNCGEEEEVDDDPCHACTARFAQSVDLKLKQVRHAACVGVGVCAPLTMDGGMNKTNN